jgi:thymidine kinase
MTLIEDARNYQVVAIDEGQFFKDIVLFCETLASENVIVIVAALDSTFERKPFGQIT